MDAFIGEVRAFGFSWVPQGWLACDGNLYSIQQYQALFTLLGTTFGGNGQTTFGVPDLRSLNTLGVGAGPGLTPRAWAASVGSETASISIAQLPVHNHAVVAKTIPQATNIAANTSAAPATTAPGSWLSRPAQVTPAVNFINAYLATPPDNPMHSNSIGVTGNGSAHENRQPYLPMLYCICFDGAYPIHD